MRYVLPVVWLSLAFAAGAHAATGDASSVLKWETLADLPDSLGVAGPYAGASSGVLIVAGGANFPDGPPWAGHAKKWHDTIYILKSEAGTWERAIEKLPTPRGYGVSLTTPQGILCIGGSDIQRHYSDVFLLAYIDGRIVRAELPALPTTLANACGAIVGHVVYVAGGIASPSATEATKLFLSLDLSKDKPAWETLEPWPGPERMLAVAAVQEKSFFLMSGVQLVPDEKGKTVRKYLTDAYRYAPQKGWRRIADLPHAVAAAPSPAMAVGSSHVFVFGGDDGFFYGPEPKEEHPGFSRDVLAYHTVTDTWAARDRLTMANVTVPVVPWSGGYVVPSGECRPGVRSPAIGLARAIQSRAAFGALNYVTLALYLLGMVGIGAYFARREKSTDQFFRGSQRIPWWAAGLSIYATMLSSITYMAVPAKAFGGDWTFSMNSVAIFLLAPLVVSVYLPFFRQLDVTSAYEYLERRFNLAVRLFGSASFILFQIGRVSIVLYLPALALATVCSLDIYTCIIVMGVLCVVYTVMGGIEAVIWTDVVQAVILAGGAILAIVFIVLRIDGGASAAWSIATTDAKFFEQTNFSWDTATATATVVLVGGFFGQLVSYTASQDVVQRYVTTKDQKRAARSIWMNAAVSLPSTAVFFLVGTMLYVFYKSHPQQLDPTMPADAVFPQFIVREMPAGVAGFIVAGIFAAAQSTLASSLNSVATAYVTDFHRRFRPESTDRENLRLAQWITVMVGMLGVVIACLMASINIASAWDMFLELLGLTGGALAGLFALGIFTRRANGPGTLVGVAASVVGLYWIQRSGRVNFMLYAMVGIVLCFVAGYIASLLIPAKPKSLEGLTIFTKRSSEPMDA